MKICKKCKNEFKEDYEYCPKCGISSITNKRVQINKISQITFKNSVVYIAVGCLVLLLLLLMIIGISDSKNKKNNQETTSKVEAINSQYDNVNYILNEMITNNNKLKKHYDVTSPSKNDDYIKSNFLSDDKTTSLSISFNSKEELFSIIITYDQDDADSCSDIYEIMASDIMNLSSDEKSKVKEIINHKKEATNEIIGNYEISNNSSDIIIVWINDTSKFKNKDSKEENSSDEIESTKSESKPIETQPVTYTIKYNELGDYGKYMEFEKKTAIFYYLPDGNYKIEVTNMNENICFLWVDYRTGYQNGNYGTAYNTKEMLKFSKTIPSHTITLDSSVHIYNSNDCDYKLTLIK